MDKHKDKYKRKNKYKRKSKYKHKWLITLFTAILLTSAVLLVMALYRPEGKIFDTDMFDRDMSVLRDAVWTDIYGAGESQEGATGGDGASATVFLSVCDTTQRASVFHSSGESLDEAWNSAAALAREFISDNRYDAVWIKADVVNKTETLPTENLPNLVQTIYDEFFRRGIAFDSGFEIAFLESEINSNKLIDYDKTDQLDLEVINQYLTTAGQSSVEQLPQVLTLFTCKSYLLDDGSVFPLYEEGLDTGRRIDETLDKEEVADLIHSASLYLAGLVQEDGKFIYGYYPTYDKELQDYNILRHSGTIWSLLSQYKMTGDSELLPKIEATIRYLVEEAVEYKDPNTAYVVERKSNEIKLGGNAVALLALLDYMEVFKTDTYEDLAIALGNGILSLFDETKGTYYHVLNFPGFTEKEAYRTVYYDGEATFALCRLYSWNKDERWLTAARVAVDHFVAADYVQYRDHWVAYSMNEITKWVPDEAYLTFALRNANENLDVIYHQETTYHTYMELLMATFEVYERMREEEIEIPYLEEFDDAYFIETIFRRAEHMRNGFFYPEYAMYLKNPQRILGAFFVRHDGFRVRIDDIQHFAGGYYSFHEHYETLNAYRSSFNIISK